MPGRMFWPLVSPLSSTSLAIYSCIPMSVSGEREHDAVEPYLLRRWQEVSSRWWRCTVLYKDPNLTTYIDSSGRVSRRLTTYRQLLVTSYGPYCTSLHIFNLSDIYLLPRTARYNPRNIRLSRIPLPAAFSPSQGSSGKQTPVTNRKTQTFSKASRPTFRKNYGPPSRSLSALRPMRRAIKFRTSTIIRSRSLSLHPSSTRSPRAHSFQKTRTGTIPPSRF